MKMNTKIMACWNLILILQDDNLPKLQLDTKFGLIAWITLFLLFIIVTEAAGEF